VIDRNPNFSLAAFQDKSWTPSLTVKFIATNNLELMALSHFFPKGQEVREDTGNIKT